MQQVEPTERRPLTAMQTSMVLASMRDPHSGVYLVQDVCETPEALDCARLRRAWRMVAGRQPALRTTIEMRAGRAYWATGRRDRGYPVARTGFRRRVRRGPQG